MVATSEPLAAQAGLWMLRQGGSAVDAAIATAITLTVVEPTSNGIGSDAFALVWDGVKLHGLNGSGRAPAAHTAELFANEGHASMPQRGWRSVTVPGAPATWRDLHARFGKLPFATLFEPAIDYARNGFPVGPVTAEAWEILSRFYRAPNHAPLSGPASQPFWELFAHAFSVIFIFNLVDLLILDWLIVCWLKPHWVMLPGTGHIVIPKPYLHHFKGFLLGTVLAVVVGLAIAALPRIEL